MPIALVHQSDGSLTVVRMGDTGWKFGYFVQFAWWPHGTGLVDIGRVAPGFVAADMFGLRFVGSGRHWVGGTVGSDVLVGTSAADELFGFAGNDRLDGGAASTLRGSPAIVPTPAS